MPDEEGQASERGALLILLGLVFLFGQQGWRRARPRSCQPFMA
jgi:hypothetical protein